MAAPSHCSNPKFPETYHRIRRFSTFIDKIPGRGYTFNQKKEFTGIGFVAKGILEARR